MKLGRLSLCGWAGHYSQAVEIVGETPKRTRIRAITITALAGARRHLMPGETALVPKYAVREVDAAKEQE